MKIDLHCHSFYSREATSSPRKLIKTAKEKGVNGIALTDHDTISGWEEAKKSSKEFGIFLILGEEIKTKKGDILGLFLEKEIKSRDPIGVIKEIKAQNGIVVLPHPFFFPEHFRDNLEKYVNLIDGIEVFNARCPFQGADKKALNFAKKYNLALIGGSDAHYSKDVGNGVTIAEAKNLIEFKEAIVKRWTSFEGKKSPFYSLFFLPLAFFGLRENES